MNSHDIDALHGLADNFTDVGEVHLAAPKSIRDSALADRFGREGERFKPVGRVLLQLAESDWEGREDAGTPFQLIDKLRMAVDDWLDDDDEAERSAACEGKARLAFLIESYLRSPELSGNLREILHGIRLCVSAAAPADASGDLRGLARD